eukprot:TRINITY_DN75531_c0_g1_i1.p1 TRINITY_DN75531_c0_g1~~TRINITY_DN75531_c0_g1_i1.p1  ORF type:complete len:491 (-),score=280.17 TRINITY_DN75531_c0_g1_i1:250-1722(-)
MTKMKTMMLMLVLAVVVATTAWAAKWDYQPQQIHLSYADVPTMMMVTWSTMLPTGSSIVEYGPASKGVLSMKASGTATKFVDGGLGQHTQMIHRVLMDNLVPGEKYVYHVGSPEEGWSELFFFTAQRTLASEGADWVQSYAVYGDLGDTNSRSLSRVQEEVQAGLHDAVVHLGDYGYDLHSDNASVGDAFMNDIQSVAGYVAYMTTPGNHEYAYNFSNYRNRFSMPGKGKESESLYFSWNHGRVHWVSISTEAYFFNESLPTLAPMWQWLQDDLATANLPENRAKQPWIIVYGHRPMYCSNADADDCTKEKSRLRLGLAVNGTYKYGMEKLLYEAGVDLVFFAHEHSSERMWPVYNEKVVNGTADPNNPYRDPGSPMYITTGSAGCQEDHDIFHSPPYAPWSAWRSTDYAYGRLHVYNETHINWQIVSDDQHGKVIDDVWLEKSSHGPFAPREAPRVPKEKAALDEFNNLPIDPKAYGTELDKYKKLGLI